MRASYTILHYESSDIVRFKGALVQAIQGMASEEELVIFHNHHPVLKDKHIAGYQRIQYRLHEHQGKTYIALYAIAEGVELLDRLLKFGITILPKKTEKTMELRPLLPTQYFENVRAEYSPTPIIYQVTNYIPLNNTVRHGQPSNLDIYHSMTRFSEKMSYLEELLEKHFLSVAHFLHSRLEDKAKNSIKILDLDQMTKVHIHYDNLQFDLKIQSYISLPQLISIGNIRAENHGILQMMENGM